MDILEEVRETTIHLRRCYVHRGYEKIEKTERASLIEELVELEHYARLLKDTLLEED